MTLSQLIADLQGHQARLGDVEVEIHSGDLTDPEVATITGTSPVWRSFRNQGVAIEVTSPAPVLVDSDGREVGEETAEERQEWLRLLQRSAA